MEKVEGRAKMYDEKGRNRTASTGNTKKKVLWRRRICCLTPFEREWTIKD